MALLDPKQIHQVLKEEGAMPTRKAASGAKENLAELLEKNNLSADEVLDNLSSLMRSAPGESTRLRAAETALKLNGLLDADDKGANFNVVININDSQFSSLNPILIPR